jgi:excisionase family DNA binding protein
VAVQSPDRLWSLPETAEFLGIPEQTLYHWISRGTGPRSYRVGRFRRYDPSEVLAWLKTQSSDRSAS